MEAIRNNIKQELKRKGVPVKKNYPVLGMTCASCAGSVENALKPIHGVLSASVNFAGQSLQVEYDPSLAQPEEMQKALQSVGYDIIIDEHNGEEKRQEIQETQRS